MGIWSGLIGGRTLDGDVERVRRLLASGDLEGARKAADKAAEKWPGASALRDVSAAVRRAQAHARIQELTARIAASGEAVDYDELASVYLSAGLREERLRLLERYAAAHGNLAAPHRLLGEAALDEFFLDFRVRDGRRAIDHLLKAGMLQADALEPRLLLAEVYFAIGADRALLGQAAAIERLAGDDDVLKPVVATLRAAATPTANESIDALLAKVEVAGALARDPSEWSSRKRQGITAAADGALVTRNLARLVRDEVAEQAVAVDRAGEVLATAGGKAADAAEESEAAAEGEAKAAEPTSGLAGVARAVARTVRTQVRELEMGSFRRCVVEGPFGVMVVAEAAGGVVAARARRGTDPHRLAERLETAVEGIRGRKS